MGPSISLALIGAVFIVLLLTVNIFSFTFTAAETGNISVCKRTIKASSITQNFLSSFSLGIYILLSLLYQSLA